MILTPSPKFGIFSKASGQNRFSPGGQCQKTQKIQNSWVFSFFFWKFFSGTQRVVFNLDYFSLDSRVNWQLCSSLQWFCDHQLWQIHCPLLTPVKSVTVTLQGTHSDVTETEIPSISQSCLKKKNHFCLIKPFWESIQREIPNFLCHWANPCGV